MISFSLDISPDTKNDVKFVQYCVPSVHNSVRRTRRPIKSLVKLQTRDRGCWCQSPHFMALSLYEECSAGRDTGRPAETRRQLQQDCEQTNIIKLTINCSYLNFHLRKSTLKNHVVTFKRCLAKLPSFRHRRKPLQICDPRLMTVVKIQTITIIHQMTY